MARGAERARREVRGGRLATLAVLFLLLVVGFGVGLLAGAVYEEPTLVVEHLRGRTESVPLAPRDVEDAGEGEADAREDEARNAVEPAPVAAEPVRITELTREASPVPAPELPQAQASGRFAVQVGAFTDEDAARRLARELLALGLPVYIERGEGRAPFRVRVGRFASRAQAEQVAHRLKREQRLPTWVLTQER